MTYNIELYVNGTFELSTYGIDDNIDSPSCYDDLLGEDIINLDYLCYDGERIYFEIEYVWQYNGEYHLNQIINGKWQAPFAHNVRYDLPSEEMDEDTWTDD